MDTTPAPLMDEEMVTQILVGPAWFNVDRGSLQTYDSGLSGESLCLTFTTRSGEERIHALWDQVLATSTRLRAPKTVSFPA